MKKWIALLLSMLLAVGLSGALCTAAAVEPDREGTLTVQFSLEGAPDLSGMVFDLYPVAEANADDSLTLCPTFADLDAVLTLTPDDSWSALASEAANLVRQKGVSPLKSLALNGEGTAVFEGLRPGIYLVLPNAFTCAAGTVYGMPTLAVLPLDDQGLRYDVTVKPKGGITTEADYLEVIVLWEDAGFEAQRPREVSVALSCDGAVADTRSVRADEGWQYRWEPLPIYETMQRGPRVTFLGAELYKLDAGVTLEGAHSWYVTEQALKGYTTTYAVNGAHTFVIINTIKAGPPEPEGNLPQTGVLWWPVPLLAALGLGLLTLGVIAGRKRERDA